MVSKSQQKELSQQYVPPADEIDLLDILRILVRQKWLIFGITVLSTALAVGIALLLPREYRVEVITMSPLSYHKFRSQILVRIEKNHDSGGRHIIFF